MDTKQGLNIFLQWSVLYAVTGFFSSLLLNNLPCTASFSTHCRLYGKWSYLWSIKSWRIIKPQVIKITIEFEWDNFENNEINNMFYLYDNVVSVLLFVFSVTVDWKRQSKRDFCESSWLLAVLKACPQVASKWSKTCSKFCEKFLKSCLVSQKVACYENKS